MSLRVLVDMNLSPGWVGVLEEAGWQAVHWAQVGDPRASDQAIMAWASDHGYALFAHDLAFGSILPVTRASGPSVIQVRAQDVMPDRLAGIVCAALRSYEHLLETGALIIVDERGLRARVLPLRA